MVTNTSYANELPVGRYPDGAQVAAAWILSVPGIQIDSAGTQLPWDLDVPFTYGYAQLTVVGGVPNQNVPYFQTMVQCDCWVEAPSEDRIFRMQSQDLAKQVQLGGYDRKNTKRGVTPAPYVYNGQQIVYQTAHVESVYTLSEPHDILSPDNQFYAGASFDFMITWTTNIKVN